jgi:hypothetical protein
MTTARAELQPAQAAAKTARGRSNFGHEQNVAGHFQVGNIPLHSTFECGLKELKWRKIIGVSA